LSIASLNVTTNNQYVVARGTDENGNQKAVTNIFFYGVRSPLTINSNGIFAFKATANGTFGNPTNNANLVMGKRYAIQVSVPTSGDGTNYLFSNIVSSASGPSLLTTYTFLMTSNLVLDVNFVPNQFFAQVGTYNGLFDNGDLSLSNRGFWTMKVAAPVGKLGTFSGSVQVNGYKWGFKGTFNHNGLGTSLPVDRSLKTDTALAVTVQLPFGAGDQVTGSVSNVDWNATLLGYRAETGTNFDGAYTLALPGVPGDSVNQPGGDGYGLIIVTNNGVKLTGSKLADGQNLGQTITLSENGYWPLYCWANKDAVSGQFKGLIMGWLVYTNGGLTNSGDLVWINQGVAGTRYSAGFSNVITEVLGSAYNAAANPKLTLNDGNGVVNLDGAALSSLGYSVKLTNGLFNFGTNGAVIKLTLTPATGKVAGTVKAAGSPYAASATPISGVLLQNLDVARGYFAPIVTVNSNYTGQFQLNAAP